MGMQILKGSHTGAKTRRHLRDCQRCGRRFTTTRVVPYCPSCYAAKHGGRRS